MSAPGDPHPKPEAGPPKAAPADVTVESPSPIPRAKPAPSDKPKPAAPARPRPKALAFDPPTAPGDIGTLGPYRVVKELGHGGMGAVYLAHDTRLNRKLALKVMLPRFAAQPAARERFLREARAAAQISHDNVVTVYEADERNGVPYIAMQFLKGSSLEDYLSNKGILSMSQIVRIARETAAGLAAAHKIGLVHRDIKPANLWLEAPNGRIKVLDFGLAKPLDSDIELTTSGMIVGTPVYMSPEQARGQHVDGRSDLFSLGGVLYRLCAGQLPFIGNTTMALLMALGTEEPRPLQELNPQAPQPLAELIHQLLAKNPDLRPQTADEVVKRARAIAEGFAASRSSPGAQGPHGAGSPDQSQVIHVASAEPSSSGSGLLSAADYAAGRKKVFWMAVVVVALAVIAGGVIFVVTKDKSGQPTGSDLPRTVTVPIKGINTKEETNAGADAKPPALVASAVAEPKSPSPVNPRPETRPTLPQALAPDTRPIQLAKFVPTAKAQSAVVDADRQAAQWALSLSGTVFARGVNRAITAAADLPANPFTLVSVRLSNTRLTDASLEHLSDLKGLDVLSLDGTRVSDAGLAHLKNLNSLHQIYLQGAAAVTDAGLDQLQGLKGLRLLWLGHTAVTDAGLTRLKNFPELTNLGLSGTAVTDAGLAQVSQLKGLTFLHLTGTKVSDAGLARLQGLKTLTNLEVQGTNVTKKGLIPFHAAVPACQILYDNGTIEPGSPTPQWTIADVLTSPDYQWTAPKDLGPAMNVGGSQADPYVTPDGLELWFASAIGNGASIDIWVSRRRSLTASWGRPVNAGQSINTPAWESMPRLTADGLILTFSRQPRNAPFQIFQTSRAAKNAPWDPATAVKATAGAVSPNISADGLEIIFTRGGQILRTTRPDRKSDWAAPMPVGELNGTTWIEPRWLSADGLWLMGFSRAANAPGEYWVVERTAPGKPWHSRKKLDLPASRTQILHPFPLQMTEGLELYFSTPAGRIQVARRIPKTDPG